MSALDDLKDRIDSAIYTNTEQNITGDGLQTVLDDMVDTMGVSVSQNSETGHLDLTIGNATTPMPSLQDVDNVEFLIDEKQVIPSDASGWSAYKDCSMRKNITYILSNTSANNILVITLRKGISEKEELLNLNAGNSIEYTPNDDIDNLRMYASSAVLEIKAKHNKFEEIAENDAEQDTNISQLETAVFEAKKNSGSGWGDWTAYTFHRGYSYKITNISSNADSRIIAFDLKGVTYSGDVISNLAPNQTATIIPNNDAAEFRAYFNGGAGTIKIEGTLNITESIYGLKKEVEIQEGFSSKDQIRHQVIVSKDGAEGHYSSIAEAYAAVTDSSYTNQYEVIVYPGKYNELNLVPPPFTHTHGLAPNSVVVSSEGVDTESNLPVFDQKASSSKLSNMTIESHNGYCIHYDVQLDGQVIMNENLILDKADTPNNTWYVVGGGSFQLGTKYIWKNCVFKCRGNYGEASCHTNGNLVNDNTHLVFDGCTFVHCNPRNGSVGGFGNCVVELVNCNFPIGERGLENWYSPIRNIDNPELYRYKKNEWQVIGGGNKNLSMWQLQNGKTIRLVADYPITISGSAASVIFGYNPYVNNVKTARLDCTLTSEYYIDDSQAGYPPYSEAKDVYQLWKRLGDCSSENKTLTVTVNNVSKTYTFTEDYLTSKTAQTTIIAAMQAVLDNVTIEAITDSGYGYDNVNTSDILFVKVTAADIIKGEFITRSGAKATSVTDIKDIVGVACEDKPINEYVKVWTSAFRFDTDYADGEYGLDANGALDANAVDKIGFVKGYNFYLY